MPHHFVRFLASGLLAIAITGTYSCNKAFPEPQNELRKEYPSDTANIANNDSKKVLYLIIDGARGSEVDSLHPAHITELTKTAVYSWRSINGFNPYDTTVVGSWATMLLGVNSSKHEVINNFNTANFGTYPSLVSRIKTLMPSFNVASFSSAPEFNQYLAPSADKKQAFAGNDASVSTAIINELGSNDSARLLIGQFGGVAKAGQDYGYSHRIPQYAAAITTVDAYIGKIMEALKKRQGYAKEDWLVVVASNHNGGVNYHTGDSTSAYDDTRRNSFVILSNRRFKPKFLGYPASTKGLAEFKDSTLLFQGLGSNGVNVKVDNPGNILDFKKGQAMTIEFKTRFLNAAKPSGDAFMNFVGNIEQGYGYDGPGWGMKYNTYQGRDNFLFYASGSTIGFDDKTKNLMADNRWHTVSFVMDWTGGENGFYVSTFVDGELNFARQKLVPNTEAIGRGWPLTIGAHNGGWASNSTLDHYITDVRVWNVALPFSTIIQYACRTEIPANSPYIGNLIMNYKVSNGVIRDYSNFHRADGVIQDPSHRAVWTSFSVVSNAICPAPDNNFYKATPNGIDVPLHIYQWLGIIPATSWNLEGIFWPLDYEDVVLPERF